MIDPEQLRGHADRIRASNVLGRSELMQRLFDFFVECSLAGRVPKEIEVAIDVFGKKVGFEVAQDAMVRVYIHKLRRKLAEYYVGPGRNESGRLTIPKGEYRFVFEETLPAVASPVGTALELETDAEAEIIAEAPVTKSRPAWLLWTLGIVGVLLAANLLTWFFLPRSALPSLRQMAEVRANPIWRDMLDDNLPVYIVVGDYYIFGELDEHGMSVYRLVRDFNINSRNELEQFLKNNPTFADRYQDVALQYLPISTAFALKDVMPVLEPNDKSPQQVQILLASELTPNIIKSSHVVYIGLLSGMGLLREIAFAGSKFDIGESFDELVDRGTQQHYISQAMAVNEGTKYRDYGYFSTFNGPSGNRIVVLAGTRDVAVMHTAEALTHLRSLTQVASQAKATQNVEVLFRVEALERTNLDGGIIDAGPLNAGLIWGDAASAKASQETTGVDTRQSSR